MFDEIKDYGNIGSVGLENEILMENKLLIS